jgi:hypothetical protein
MMRQGWRKLQEEVYFSRQRIQPSTCRIPSRESEARPKKNSGQIFPLSVADEIKELWQQLIHLDWRIEEPRDLRDTQLLQSISSPIVLWFLFAEIYFSKRAFDFPEGNLLDALPKLAEESNSKSIAVLSGFLTSLIAGENQCSYSHFDDFFLQSVL